MGGGSMKSNPTKSRKRVAAEEESPISAPSPLLRGKDGSAFTRCEECNKDVPVALISMHSCSLDAKIKMNLNAEVVERPSEPIKKPSASSRKRSSCASDPRPKRAKKEGKDPNAPKRPLTAFFIFMDEFRKTYKEANPDSKGGKMAVKGGGDKWHSMTDEEKKPYVDKAVELKADYLKAMQAYNAEDGDGETEEAGEKEASEKEVEQVAEKEEASEKEQDAEKEEASEKEVEQVTDGE